MSTAQPSVNYKALSWTIGAHVVILLFLLLWRFSTPAAAAPVVEMGMEVNLGTSADGSGTDQPMDMDDPAAEAAASKSQSTAQEEAAERDVEQTDDAEAPDVAPIKPVTKPVRPTPQAVKPPTRNNTPTTATTTTKPAPVAQPQKPKYTYKGSNGRGGNGAQENKPGTGEGNTTGNGDRGVPNGTPGAANYTGSPGKGTGGISSTFRDRSIVSFPPKEAEFREGGRVVVRVTVNREGTIVNKQVVSATNAELRPIALRKLIQVKFNRNDDAPAEQFGNITFDFKTRN